MKYIKVKGIKADLKERNLSCSIVNTIRGKYLRALKRPNKGKKNIVTPLKIGIIGLIKLLY